MNVEKSKTTKKSGWILVSILMLFTGRSEALTQAEDIVVTPARPVPGDTVVLTIYGVWNTGCVPNSPQTSISGSNEIRVAFPAESAGPCEQLYTPWAEAVVIGQQAIGAYEVVVTVGETEIGRSSFTVGNSIPVDLRRVICRNMRTGKSKSAVIRDRAESAWSPDDFGACAAAGLKVRPGDKVRQTFIGRAGEKRQ
jgi:hypothetical protein